MLNSGDAFQARATHASHRARILGLGLSVGIAIAALSGCDRPTGINLAGKSKAAGGIEKKAVFVTAPNPEDDPKYEVYDHAAMKAVMGEGLVLTGCGVLGDVSASETAAMRKRIAKKQAWASSVTDARWRAAYANWLDYAKHCTDEADNGREVGRPEQLRWERDTFGKLDRLDREATTLPPPRTASAIDARQRRNRATGSGPKGESAVARVPSNPKGPLPDAHDMST